VTGSSGHLGEALVRVLRGQGREVVGLDLLASPYTTVTGPVTDRAVVRRCLDGVCAVLHAATLHKPHIGSHQRQAFVDTNVSGTLTLLEESVAAGVESFVFTSSTSVFGRALTPLPGEPATWITEDVTPVPRNIYGVTKAAAEDLCEIIARDHGLPVVVLRVARFFPEDDDRDEVRAVLRELREIGVDILTLGQYLRPSDGHIALDRYVTPEEFRRNPFLEFMTILDERGVPFQEPIGQENDDRIPWSRDQALVGSDAPGDAGAP
jgi:nucleoside-diphosphate-sugar epimerase